MDLSEKVIEKLGKDCEIILNEKLTKALESNNEGTYRNLVKALETNLELMKKYESIINTGEYEISIDYKGNCTFIVCFSKEEATKDNVEKTFNKIIKHNLWLK